MDEIIFLMEVNKYNGIIYRPYNHAATLLITEFQTTRWISCSAHKISNNKVQSFLYTFQAMLKSYSTTNKNPLKHRALSLLSLLGAEMVVWRPCAESILRSKINKDEEKKISPKIETCQMRIGYCCCHQVLIWWCGGGGCMPRYMGSVKNAWSYSFLLVSNTRARRMWCWWTSLGCRCCGRHHDRSNKR